MRRALTLAVVLLLPSLLYAHCDSVAGPVVQSAKAALDAGDVTPVLKWVRAADEPEIRFAFQRALVVRKQSVEAKAVADQFFFETVVRVHRAGEGEPFTGLKPAEALRDEPAAVAVDQAIAAGSGEGLIGETVEHLRHQLEERYARVAAARKRADQSVAAGREYVAAYVELVHFLKRLTAQPEHAHAEVAAHRD